MTDVFISYQSRDEELAKRLRSVLSFNGYDVWFAPANIPRSGDFVKEISRNLSAAKAFILILSKNAMSSSWVLDELTIAKDKGKKIIALRVDHENLSDEFDFLLKRVNIIQGYHLDKASVDLVLEDLGLYIEKKRTRQNKDHSRFSEYELGVHRIARGDPYYEEGTTIAINYRRNKFFLAPPRQAMENDSRIRDWCLENGFATEDRVFDTTLNEITELIPIPNLMEQIERSREKVFQQFRNKENGCYYNNKKFGIENVNPFARTIDEKETPKLELDLFTTDYFTHRVMKDVCKTLILDGCNHFNEINYSHLGPNKIFYTSLGINLILAEDSLEDPGILITSRSSNASETNISQRLSLSVIEGVSISDYDSYLDTVSLSLAAKRGLIEELRVTEEMIQLDKLRFYDFFVIKSNQEMGISCTALLKKNLSLANDVINLHGKDEELEISDKREIKIRCLESFIRDNRAAFNRQALFVLCSYLENFGILMMNQYELNLHKKESFICSKEGDDGPCGDRIVDSEFYIAIIDGATPKGNRLWNGCRGDVFVSNVLASAIEELDPDLKAQEAIDRINNAIKEQYHVLNLNYEDLESEERLQASVVIYSRNRHEIWSFGDCMLRINGRNYRNIRKGETLFADLRAFCLEYASINGLETDETDDYGREQILPFLKQYTCFSNSSASFGYDVLNGGEIHEEHVKIYAVQPGDRIVMASDGYPELFDSLQETEEYLTEALRKDPNCTTVIRGTKGLPYGAQSYDDRSFIGFTVI